MLINILMVSFGLIKISTAVKFIQKKISLEGSVLFTSNKIVDKGDLFL